MVVALKRQRKSDHGGPCIFTHFLHSFSLVVCSLSSKRLWLLLLSPPNLSTFNISYTTFFRMKFVLKPRDSLLIAV